MGVTRPSHRLLALGDSYTVGEGVAPGEAWPQQLAQRLADAGWSVEPTILATTAWTSGELLAAFDGQPPDGPFMLVALQIGVNDQYRGLPLEEFTGNVRALLDRAHQQRAGKPGGVLAVSIPDWGVTPFAAGEDRAGIAAGIDAFNRVYRELALAAAIPFVDVTAISRTEPNAVAPDGLHPSGAQYRQWVDLIAPVAESLLGAATG